MTVKLGTAARSALADALNAQANAGAGAATLEIRTGAQPTHPGDSASGTLLATFTLNDPAFGAAASGVITLGQSPALTTTGVAAGTAGYARLKDSNGVAVLDCSVGTSGTDITINTTTVSIGLALAISGTITQPE